MRTRAESVRVAYPLFQVGGGGSTPTSALQLRIDRIPIEKAIELNRHWHSILPRFGTGFIKNQPFPCFSAVFQNLIYAVAIWSNPAARNLPQKEWLELRRMAIADDAPKNTASRMLSIMRAELHRSLPEVVRVVSYSSDSVHRGTMYKADGWLPMATCKADTWDRPGRARLASQQIDNRIRWERPIVGRPEASPTAEVAQS